MIIKHNNINIVDVLQKQPVPVDYARTDPPNSYIYRFIKNLFISAQVNW